MCGLPLDLGGLADDVALVPEIVYVHELVSQRRDLGSPRVDCVDPSKETRHLRRQRDHCISVALLIPREATTS